MTINVLVTGASGFIGSHLVNRLIHDHFNVSVLIRKTTNQQWLKNKPITLIYGDLNDPTSYETHLSKQAYIFHLGGIVRATREKYFFDINSKGTKLLIDAVNRECKQLKKFIFLSSLEAGGPSNSDHIRTEKDADNPITAYGKSKLLAEKILLAHKIEIDSVIIRPPLVYGPRDIGLYEFFKSVKKGLTISIGSKEQYASSIYVDDLIDVLMISMQDTITSGSMYYIADQSTPHKIAFIQSCISDLLEKRKTFHISIPKYIFFLICIAGHFFQNIFRTVFWLNLTRYRTLTQQNWSCSPNLLEKVTGYKPKISFSEGINNTYQWYKEHHWI